MHPLGYDPDPALHGEGSSTGRRRRVDDDDHSSPHETYPVPPMPVKRRRHVAPSPLPPPPPSDTLLPIHLRVIFRPDDPHKTVSMTTTFSPPPLLPPPLPARHDHHPLSPSPHKRPAFLPPSPEHLRRPLVGGGKPRRGRGRGGATAGTGTRGGAAAPRASRASRRATRSRRTSATPTTLESIAQESVALRAEIKRLGLSLRDVTADGNCLFRALADQVWGDQTRHAYVRQIVCDELARNEDELREFVAGFLIEGEEYGAYVDRMRGQGVYGSHIELMAATKVFKRSIRVVLAQTSYTVEYTGEPHDDEDADDNAPKDANDVTEAQDGPEVTETPPRRRTRASNAAAAEPMPRGRPGHRLLWLALFSDAEHYESVRRQGPGSSSGPADVPDSLAIPHERDQSEAARAERAESGSGRKRSAATDAAAARFIADGRVAQVIASLPPWHGVSDADAAQVLVRTDGDVSKTIDILFDQLDSDGDGDDSSGDSHSDTSTSSASALLEFATRTPSSSPEDHTSGESRSTRTPDTPDMSVSPASTAPTSPLSNASEYSDKPSPPASDRVLRSATRSAPSASGRRRPRRGAGKM